MAMADWLRECRVDTVAMEATIKSASVHVQRMQKALDLLQKSKTKSF
jgi:hypothetical protein